MSLSDPITYFNRSTTALVDSLFGTNHGINGPLVTQPVAASRRLLPSPPHDPLSLECNSVVNVSQKSSFGNSITSYLSCIENSTRMQMKSSATQSTEPNSGVFNNGLIPCNDLIRQSTFKRKDSILSPRSMVEISEHCTVNDFNNPANQQMRYEKNTRAHFYRNRFRNYRQQNVQSLNLDGTCISLETTNQRYFRFSCLALWTLMIWAIFRPIGFLSSLTLTAIKKIFRFFVFLKNLPTSCLLATVCLCFLWVSPYWITVRYDYWFQTKRIISNSDLITVAKMHGINPNHVSDHKHLFPRLINKFMLSQPELFLNKDTGKIKEYHKLDEQTLEWLQEKIKPFINTVGTYFDLDIIFNTSDSSAKQFIWYKLYMPEVIEEIRFESTLEGENIDYEGNQSTGEIKESNCRMSFYGFERSQFQKMHMTILRPSFSSSSLTNEQTVTKNYSQFANFFGEMIWMGGSDYVKGMLATRYFDCKGMFVKYFWFLVILEDTNPYRHDHQGCNGKLRVKYFRERL